MAQEKKEEEERLRVINKLIEEMMNIFLEFDFFIQLEAEKKEKEAQKKQIKKERKNLRTIVKVRTFWQNIRLKILNFTNLQNNNYYATNEEEKVTLMEDIERLIDLLTLNE